MTDILHLVLKHKYFDMIADGSKRVEYRSYYWKERVKGKTVVVFHRGYTNHVLAFQIQKIVLADQIQIHLGEQVARAQKKVKIARAL